MRKILSFLFLCLGICFGNVFADSSDFFKDLALVEKLQENHVKLVVIRHGEAINNFKNRITTSNSPGYYLTMKGRAQIDAITQALKSEKIDKVFCSPLFRCMHATQILGEGLGLTADKLLVENRLNMQNLSGFEGISYSEYEHLFPTLNAMLESDIAQESSLAVFNRTRDFLWHLANNSNHHTIVLITHAFNYCHVAKCLTGSFGRLPKAGDYIIYDYSAG